MTNTIYHFSTSSGAWQFMRACDDAGIMAGYPDGRAPRYTVKVVDPDGIMAARAAEIEANPPGDTMEVGS
jgi:hypothetical protein